MGGILYAYTSIVGGILYAYTSIVGGFLDPSISLLENGRDIMLTPQ
jgi:hypothetical protein